MQGIDNYFRVSLTIDDILYELSVEGFFKEIRLIESATEGVPLLQIQIMDSGKLTDTYPIHDGSRIELNIINELNEEIPEYSGVFRVFSRVTTPGTDSDIITIIAYYDAPDFFKDGKFYSISGNSTQVAQRVAKDSGLEFEGDSSQDSQIWIREGITGFSFLEEVRECAYFNSESFFVKAITKEGVLRYLDLGRRRKQESDWKFVLSHDLAAEIKEDQVMVVDPEFKSNSGLLNRWRGYGVYSTRFNQSNGKTTQFSLDSMTKTSDNMEINSSLDNPSRAITIPLNAGNTHSRYHEAMVQNQIYEATYCNSMFALCPRPKNVRLLDKVSCSLRFNNRADVRTAYNVNYFVNKIITLITPSSFLTYVSLVTNEVNTEDAIKDLY